MQLRLAPCVAGSWENSAAVSGGAHLTPAATGTARYLATYANHSARRLNCRFEERFVCRAGAWDVRERMLLVTTEPVEAGAELRVDYESGRSDYWRALGCDGPPPETAWREVRRATPPSADPDDCTLDGPTLALALPVAVATAGGVPRPWAGAGGGACGGEEFRLRALARQLLGGGNAPRNYVLLVRICMPMCMYAAIRVLLALLA